MAVAEREIAVKHGIVVLQDVSFTSSARLSGDASRPSIRSERDGRVRIDAGTLLDMGCLLAGAGGNRRRLRKSSARMHPYQFFQQP